jgi:hypothetical protein
MSETCDIVRDGRDLNRLKHLLGAVTTFLGVLTKTYPDNSREVHEVKHEIVVLHDSLKAHDLLPDPPVLSGATQQAIVDALLEWLTLAQAIQASNSPGLESMMTERMKHIEGKFREKGLTLYTDFSLYLEVERASENRELDT